MMDEDDDQMDHEYLKAKLVEHKLIKEAKEGMKLRMNAYKDNTKNAIIEFKDDESEDVSLLKHKRTK